MTEVTTLAADLRLQITRLNRRLRVHTASGLTASQSSMIAALAAAGRIHLGELAELEGVTAPTATRAVDLLVGLGLAERAPDAADARKSTVELTPAGRVMAQRNDDAAVVLLTDALARRTPDEVADLTRALPSLRLLVEDLRAGCR